MAVPNEVGTSVDSATPEELVAYETLDEGRIARIWLNRPDAHNAQSRGLLVQLDEAFLRAEADDTVRVVILDALRKASSSWTSRPRLWALCASGRLSQIRAMRPSSSVS